MKKIISIILVLFISFAIFPNTFAQDTTFTPYIPATSGDAGEHMIYMQDQYVNESYSGKHFLRDGGPYPTFVAMAWPPTLRTRTNGDGYPLQNATINSVNNTITSTSSGITYTLPSLNHSASEAMILDQYGVRSASYGSQMLANLDLNAKYDKIHILIGVADSNSSEISQISAFVTYDEGTSTLPEGSVKKTSLNKDYYTYPSGLQDSQAADGRNGYLIVSSPKATAEGQSAADNFVADFESYSYKPGTGASSLTSYTSAFTKSTGTQRTVAAFEYTLDVNETKKIKSISFNHNKIQDNTSGFAVLGLVGESSGNSSIEISDFKLFDYLSTDNFPPAEHSYTTAMPANSSDSGQHLLYMQDQYANENYYAKNFLKNGGMTPTIVAMAWPPALRTRTESDGYPEQKATIDSANNTITSTNTGITYTLPSLNHSSNEAMILDQYGLTTASYGGSTTLANLNLNAKYDKINILIGVADSNASPISQISAFVTYDDGKTTLPEGSTKVTRGSQYSYTFPDGIQDSEAADGRNGYFVVSSPKATAAGQSSADNFVADFESYKYKPGTGASSLTNYTASFTKSTGTQPTIAAYEYTLDVNETKTIKSITFNHNRIKSNDMFYPAGYAVLGLVGESTSESDYKSKIEAANAAISKLAASGPNATISQIEETSKMVSELQNAGYGQYLNVNSLNGIISNTDRELYEVKKGDNFKVEFSAENTSSQNADMYLISALYDEDNMLVDTVMSDLQIPSTSEKSTLSEFVTLPNKDFDYAKFFIWDKKFKPYKYREYYSNDSIYTFVNLTDYADGKFYVGSDSSEKLLSTYHNEMNYGGNYDFAWHNADTRNKSAAQYPLWNKLNNTALLSNADGLFESPKTKVKYAMPEKRDGVYNKEAVSLNYDNSKSATINLENDIYSNIHFILASSNLSPTQVRAIVNYTDGSRDVNIVDIAKHTDTYADNCLANLSCITALNGEDFGTPNGTYVNLLLFEYSVEINQPKIVDSVTFENCDRAGNVLLTSITTEKADFDNVKDYISNKIDSNDYLAEEAESLREIVKFFEEKGIDCSEFSNIPQGDSPARQIFVAHSADSSVADGTIEKPFATIEDACEYIKTESNLYIGKWEVLFREGTYKITESIVIDETVIPSLSSLTFKPYLNEVVEFTGAETIDMSMATGVSDPIKSRLPSSSANNVVQIDLKEQNITGISPYSISKYDQYRSPASRLIINDVAYNVARWPNEGEFAIIKNVLNTSSDGNGMEFTVSNPSSNINNWNNATNALLHGFFAGNDWRSDIVSFSEYTPSTGGIKSGITTYKEYNVDKTLTLNNKSNRRFFIENLLEEIDQPGEWYIDSNNILYLYPIADDSEVSIAILSDSIFNISNVNNIHFENITFNGGVGGAIKFNNADNCEIKNCKIKNFTDIAVKFEDCINSGVKSCDMTNLGSGAVHIEENNYKTITSGNAYIIDCNIKNLARYTRTGGTGAAITANTTIGTKILNNEISDSTWYAIVLNHPINASIEYNEIFDVQKEYGDAGVIYSGQSFRSQGNLISNNYIHDIELYNQNVQLICGIYIDDMSCGFTILNNVITNTPIGIRLGGGKNLNVQNNIIMAGGGPIIGGNYAIVADSRGLDNNYNFDSYDDNLIAHIKQYPLYAFTFPHTTEKYYTDTNYYNYPANNTVTNNFFYKYDISATDEWNNSTYNNINTNNSYKLYRSGLFVGENNEFTVDSNDIDYIKTLLPNFKDIGFNKIGLATER